MKAKGWQKAERNKDVFSWRTGKLPQFGTHVRQEWNSSKFSLFLWCFSRDFSSLPTELEVFRIHSVSGSMPGKAGQSCSTAHGLACVTTCHCLQAIGPYKIFHVLVVPLQPCFLPMGSWASAVLSEPLHPPNGQGLVSSLWQQFGRGRRVALQALIP